MSTITFGGLATGLDTNSIISGLVAAEKAPVNQLTTRQTSVTSAQTSMSGFLSNVSALDTSATSLADPSEFASITATSSTSAVVATTLGNPAPGTYSMDVIALASEQRTRSANFGSSTDALGQAGTLNLQVGSGAAVPVTVAAGDSLSAIAAKITASGARVTASVMYDGSQYKLLVRGLDTGASNAVTFGESGTSLGLSDPANTYQAAGDAHVKIDGMDVTRPTNVIAGAISGVSFALTSTTSTTATINVAEDNTGLETKLQAFVSAYNNVVSSGHFTAGYGTTKAQATLLQGDSSVRSVLDKLGEMVTTPVAGASGTYSTLASVGLSVASDGSLSLDTSKLETAMSTDPTSVQKLFVKDPSTGANGIMGQLKTQLDSWTVGTTSMLQSEVSSLQDRFTELGKEIDQGNQRLVAFQAALEAQFTALELTVNATKNDASALDSLVNLSTSSSSSSSSK